MNVKSTIQWATPYSLGLLLALAVAAVVGFALLRWASGRPIAPARRVGLLVIRLAILAILGLIIINPVRVDETPGTVERPKVFYLLDTSQSMAIGKGATRWEQVVQTIRDADRARDPRDGAQVSLFRFGSRLAAVDADSARPADAEPRVPEHARRRAGRRAAAAGRAAPGADRFRHAPGRLARRSHGPVRPGAASGRGRLLRRPRPRPRSGRRDRAGLRPDEGAHPRPPGRRRERRRRRGHREHGRAQPGAEVFEGRRAGLRAELRLQGQTLRAEDRGRRVRRQAGGGARPHAGRPPGRRWPATRWRSSRATRTAGSRPGSIRNRARCRRRTTPSAPTWPSTTPRSACSTSKGRPSATSQQGGRSGLRAAARSAGPTHRSRRR